MSFSQKLSYIFRKSPLARAVLVLAVCLVVFVLTFVIALSVGKPPVIHGVNPAIGSPGDTVTITGENFGHVRDTSYVEIGGSRITASLYLSWADGEIKLTLPANVNNGLVVVGTSTGRSEPAFFAKKEDIPNIALPATQSNTPTVLSVSINGGNVVSVSPSTTLHIKTGDLLAITGHNFGSQTESSNVFFSANTPESKNESHNINSKAITVVSGNKDNYDYVYWSDTEIHVYVPDGISDGFFFVRTQAGNSAQTRIAYSSTVGKKSFPSERTYLLETVADISDLTASNNSMLTLRMPHPIQTSSQPKVEITECNPTPSISSFQNMIIFQEQTSKITAKKTSFSANVVVTVFETDTEINADKVPTNYNNMNSLLRTVALRADGCVPSADPEVINLSSEIVGSEKNPYKKARRIYDYIIDNYRLLRGTRSSSPGATATELSPLDIISSKRGDAYDFAILFTALLRAQGIPALPCAGILVDRTMSRTSHWWTEFYVQDFGWVPIDVALGAGLAYNSPIGYSERREYYFGNMDAQHILFSRGYNDIKSANATNVTVQLPRTYALQAIWEETNAASVKYSSLWNVPIVRGIY